MKNKILTAALLFAYCLPVGAQQQNTAAQKLSMTLYAISEMYVDKVDVDSLVTAQIRQLLSSLDPFTQYMPAAQADMSEAYLLGTSTAGIGAEIFIMDETPYISFVSGTAKDAGLMPGDVLLSVGGSEVLSKTINEIQTLINGAIGSQADIEIVRGGKAMTFSVMRKNQPGSSIKTAYMASRNTGYIAISAFTQNTAEEFRSKVSGLKKQGMKNLILNLENNPGGFFDSALQVADEFISAGKILVCTDGNNVGRQEVMTQIDGIMEAGRLAVIVNGRTMSAAEIFTGTIQDWDRGVIVGQRTFGKGLIQKTLPFPDGSALQLSVARYFTPSGRSIQKPYGENAAAEKPYQTLVNSRTVYGGGGIGSDVEVGVNDAISTDWYNILTMANVQKVVATEYALANRTELLRKYRNFEAYCDNFTDPMLMELLRTQAEEQSIPFIKEDYDRSAGFIWVQLKALIARELYDSDEYYHRIINAANPSVQRAVEIVGGKEYDNILAGTKGADKN